jgi:hypothetical protein
MTERGMHGALAIIEPKSKYLILLARLWASNPCFRCKRASQAVCQQVSLFDYARHGSPPPSLPFSIPTKQNAEKPENSDPPFAGIERDEHKRTAWS